MMRPSRKHRVLTALIALFGMLFMQFAVASYACPGIQAGGSSGPAASMDAPGDGAAMPDCGQPDSGKPALCHAHCEDGKSSLDKHQVRTLAPAAILSVAMVVSAEPVMPDPGARVEHASLLQRTTAPPIAIRHCCFRI